ncbi:hypothetical protein ACHAXA_008289 [Cyclostephanos tholiformis]|uniref:Uncharacterized protein n=1 Tax=Cyclostephanos tholiformis TaxID=382380 RepID=A0ABD3R6L6_9STRA
MVKLASVLAIAVIGRLPSVAAFSPTINAAKIALGQSTSLNYYPDNTFLNYHQGGDFPETQHDISLTYDRAMDCANNFGMCDIDELLDLSEELDEYMGCFVENGPEACDHEINNRQELSEALLVQGEMREHQRYVEEGNVFPYDAIGNGNMNEREESTSPRVSVWRNEDEFAWGNGESSLDI